MTCLFMVFDLVELANMFLYSLCVFFENKGEGGRVTAAGTWTFMNFC